MIIKLRQFFDQYIFIEDQVNEQVTDHHLQVACAALMIEVLYADHEFEQDELEVLRTALQDAFELTGSEADELIRLAEAEIEQATDYYQFTALINEFYTQQQKRELVTRLWQMAYADFKIHKFEEHLVRRLADLLHVPHSAFIQSKHRASADSRTRD